MPRTKKRHARRDLDSWRLRSGELVLDMAPSHVHEGVREYLNRLFAATDSRNQDFIPRTMDFRSLIGLSTVVDTYPDDEIIFARRPGRKYPSRFVLNRQAQWTPYITAIIGRRGLTYDLITAYFGESAPREPWGRERATRLEREFWDTHAFVMGAEPIVPRSEVRSSSRRRR